MKLYRKLVQVRSYGYDDTTAGEIVQDWIPEEELDMSKITYEYEYRIREKFVLYTEKNS
jgi:hypothetical protein